MLTALLTALLTAEGGHRPLPPRSPEAVVPVGLEVHVRAHEDLDPDRLRAFARPRVTLWLETRSNTLKQSTLENLLRFDAVFVRLKAPLTDAQLRAFDRAPRAGVWLDAAQLQGPGISRVLGPRALAVQLKGALDEGLFERAAAARPEVVEWLPPREPELLSWSLFKQLPGKKLVTLEPGGLSPRVCTETDRGPAARVHLASLLALGTAAFPCGRGGHVVLAVDTDRWLIQSIVVRDPTVELELEVGADDVAAKKVSALLDELGFAAHR